MTSSAHHSLLAIRGLEKSFGALRAIDDLHLDVASGGIFGIIGPNGSGKTTLFNVISGVCKPAAGTVHYRGRDLTGLPATEWPAWASPAPSRTSRSSAA